MAVNESRTQAHLSDQVAEEIRVLLARQRISGRELARRMGESPSWVNFRLSGHTQVALNDLPRFAAALGVSVLDLMPDSVREVRTTGR